MNEAINEREVSFYTTEGHDHDGVNSTPVNIPAKSITNEMLSDSLMAWILSLFKDTEDNTATATAGPIDDLTITTGTVAMGDTTIGATDYVALALIRYLKIISTPDSVCDISFYHIDSYDDPDREFIAKNCIDNFLWEGTWVHKDDTALNKLYWKLKNTGTTDASFDITIKACGVA